METIGRIRRERLVKGKSIKEIARDLKVIAQHSSEGSAIGGNVVLV